jgi:hypothetical protein
MKVNKIKHISKVIYFLDKHIIEILSKKDVDDDKLSVLSDIRILYLEELNGLIRVRNTREMYDKRYWKSYKRTNH